MNVKKLNAFEIKRIIKIILLLLALLISIVTLFLSQRLVNKIAAEETKKMEIWADAEHILSDPDSEGDLGFHLKIIQSNTTIPAILVSETGRVIQHINVQKEGAVKRLTDEQLSDKIEEYKTENEPIDIPIDEKTHYKVYYGKSTVLRQLEYYPYMVLAIVALFMLVSYFAFSYSTRSEQNQVWVGLAKETAHQLGTPISSLMGWIECLEMDIIPDNAPSEMRKDIDRLKIITERFSKIGSEPVLETVDFNAVFKDSISYMQSRAGANVHFDIPVLNDQIFVKLNVNLFNWVVENLIKNSIDAMEGRGNLLFHVVKKNDKLFVDFTDNGKGIPRNQMKNVFKPGFTTKRRGWGLGLSLAKRIIEDYHQGQIYVKDSVPLVRTTFRIILNIHQ
jgi:nitrogen-specific signal transduction histidine kinase